MNLHAHGPILIKMNPIFPAVQGKTSARKCKNGKNFATPTVLYVWIPQNSLLIIFFIYFFT